MNLRSIKMWMRTRKTETSFVAWLNLMEKNLQNNIWHQDILLMSRVCLMFAFSQKLQSLQFLNQRASSAKMNTDLSLLNQASQETSIELRLTQMVFIFWIKTTLFLPKLIELYRFLNWKLWIKRWRISRNVLFNRKLHWAKKFD